MRAGLVAGDAQVVDSTPVKAAASLDSLREKQTSGAPTLRIADEQVAPGPAAAVRPAPAHQLRHEATRRARRQAAPDRLGARHPKAQLLSNKSHYSPTDPKARISVKPSKARALNYLCSMAVDTASGIISHIQADFVADMGYSNGFNYAVLEQRGVTP